MTRLPLIQFFRGLGLLPIRRLTAVAKLLHMRVGSPGGGLSLMVQGFLTTISELLQSARGLVDKMVEPVLGYRRRRIGRNAWPLNRYWSTLQFRSS